MRDRRKREIKNRKNFLPSLALTAFLWLLVGAVIYFTNPDFIGMVVLFFILTFLALMFTFSLILANTRRGLIMALGITIFLIFRYFGIGNLLNGLLIIGITLATEIYFWYSTAK